MCDQYQLTCLSLNFFQLIVEIIVTHLMLKCEKRDLIAVINEFGYLIGLMRYEPSD